MLTDPSSSYTSSSPGAGDGLGLGLIVVVPVAGSKIATANRLLFSIVVPLFRNSTSLKMLFTCVVNESEAEDRQRPDVCRDIAHLERRTTRRVTGVTRTGLELPGLEPLLVLGKRPREFLPLDLGQEMPPGGGRILRRFGVEPRQEPPGAPLRHWVGAGSGP